MNFSKVVPYVFSFAHQQFGIRNTFDSTRNTVTGKSSDFQEVFIIIGMNVLIAISSIAEAVQQKYFPGKSFVEVHNLFHHPTNSLQIGNRVDAHGCNSNMKCRQHDNKRVTNYILLKVFFFRLRVEWWYGLQLSNMYHTSNWYCLKISIHIKCSY